MPLLGLPLTGGDGPPGDPVVTMPLAADLVVRTKLEPPRPRRRQLARPRLDERLRQARDYRLTVVHAPTGYGKSTALAAALADRPALLFWYTITEPDHDPLLFLLHLVFSFHARLPQVVERPAALLAEGDVALAQRPALEALINGLAQALPGEACLVLDDYHLVNQVPEITAMLEHLVALLPRHLHLVVATRQAPRLPRLTQWRVKGDVLDIASHDLAFSEQEIDALFRTQYGCPLTPAQVRALATETEGWAIALQLIGQGLQAAPGFTIDQVLAGLPGSMEGLFAYLAQEVLARQAPEVQEFLLATSILQTLDPAACDFVLGRTGSEALLHRLDEEGLFLTAMGHHYRCHHLFRDFLGHQLARDPARLRALHRRAADFYTARHDVEAAFQHLLAAGCAEAAADLIEAQQPDMVRTGRISTLAAWCEQLPAEVLAQRPALLACLGDASRYNSRFDTALAWYEQAKAQYAARMDRVGLSRALQGQALVYLDTVRPLQAESLLQEALRLIDGQQDKQERARVLELLAENKLNRGELAEAEALWQQARALRNEGPGEGDLDARVRLRTGRLAEARELLERRAAAERNADWHSRNPRAHRETLLVLSLIYAFQGEAAPALACAEEGIRVGQILASPFVEAVGYIRRGHALLLSEQPGALEEAERSYRQALHLAASLDLHRLEVEANWGLALLFGYHRGDLAAADRHARLGMDVGLRAGDEWISALTAVTLGASGALARQHDTATRWLGHAAASFRRCGDTFLLAVAHFWQAWLCHERRDPDGQARHMAEALDLVQAHDYGFLLTRRTLLGPPDPQSAIPLLLAASHPAASVALAQLGLSGLDYHPGYTLRVQTLGAFRVWRSTEEVPDAAWQRRKARQLFQLLLTRRGEFLQKEEICDLLWPEQSQAQAEAAFKVTLNALCKALEPARPPQAPSFFVTRREATYGLNPSAAIDVDADRFARLATAGRREAEAGDAACASATLRGALALYQGDYLPDSLYEPWSSDERERLRLLYLSTACDLARLLAQREDWNAVIDICERILARDNCWEEAYRLMMVAYDRLGNRAQALRAYQQCVRCLRDELDAEPMPETTAVYREILRG